MSNASLKEQLQAVASQLSDKKYPDNIINKPEGQSKPKNKKTIYPAAKVNKPKPRWLDYVQYGVELLKAYFPQSFKVSAEIKPLKKGIKQDLVKRLSTIESIVTDDKACMVKSLAYYVNTISYHKNMLEGATRVDLDGNKAGIVTAEEAKYSVERYQMKLQTKQNAKSAQSRNENQDDV